MTAGIGDLELLTQRRLTRAFVGQDFLRISIIRKTKVPDGGGGYTTTDSTMDPQRLAFVAVGGTPGRGPEALGMSPTATHALVGEHDADVRAGDRFSLDGRNYQVAFVHPEKDHETLAEVELVG